jgi:hypothetical protein
MNKENFKIHNNNEELPTHEQIERRAYEIYLGHGFHSDNTLGNWLAAEKERTEPSERGNMNTPAANFIPGLGKHPTA